MKIRNLVSDTCLKIRLLLRRSCRQQKAGISGSGGMGGPGGQTWGSCVQGGSWTRENRWPSPSRACERNEQAGDGPGGISLQTGGHRWEGKPAQRRQGGLRGPRRQTALQKMREETFPAVRLHFMHQRSLDETSKEGEGACHRPKTHASFWNTIWHMYQN